MFGTRNPNDFSRYDPTKLGHGYRPKQPSVLSFRKLVLVLLLFTALFWIATQLAAHLFAYQRALGAPLVRIGSFGLYPPYAYAIWVFKYVDAPGTEAVWRVVNVVFAVGLVAIMGILWLTGIGKRPERERVPVHGSAHWATLEEIEKSTLFDHTWTFEPMKRPWFWKSRLRAWERKLRMMRETRKKREGKWPTPWQRVKRLWRERAELPAKVKARIERFVFTEQDR